MKRAGGNSAAGRAASAPAPADGAAAPAARTAGRSKPAQTTAIPVFFNEEQLEFKPLYEWAFGEKIVHPETTARAESILAALQGDPVSFELREPSEIPLSSIRQIHNYHLLTLYNTARELPEDVTFYPSVFPKNQQTRGDPTNIRHAGCFCFDSGTPLNNRTLDAACWSAACAKQAAVTLRKGGYRMTYALSRPPGHHATRDLFGGYCYFNNAAIAAKYLRRYGRVAVLDIDFHHGNGTQAIFWRDPQVLVLSVHGDPREFYPFFAGHPEERGAGPGEGFNINIPLPRKCSGKRYFNALKRHVIPNLQAFAPTFLVVSAGLDAYEKDPIGDFELKTADFHTVGELIGRLHIPMCVIQEGGYYTPHLGRNARALLHGLREGAMANRKAFKS